MKNMAHPPVLTACATRHLHDRARWAVLRSRQVVRKILLVDPCGAATSTLARRLGVEYALAFGISSIVIVLVSVLLVPRTGATVRHWPS